MKNLWHYTACWGKNNCKKNLNPKLLQNLILDIQINPVWGKTFRSALESTRQNFFDVKLLVKTTAFGAFWPYLKKFWSHNQGVMDSTAELKVLPQNRFILMSKNRFWRNFGCTFQTIVIFPSARCGYPNNNANLNLAQKLVTRCHSCQSICFD